MNQTDIDADTAYRHKWLAMSEAAKLCPYSAEYLSLLARKNKLPAKKINGVWFTTKTTIDSYMARQMMLKNAVHTANFDSGINFQPRQTPDDTQDTQINEQEIQKSRPEEKRSKSDNLPNLPEEFIQKFSDYLDASIDKHLGFSHRIWRGVRRAFKKAFSSPLIAALTIILFLSIIIFPTRSVFGFVTDMIEKVYDSMKDAQTVLGFRPGTHANEILLLDKNGNIAIMGHIETEGQLKSFVKDGIAPIVVDSKTLVENLNADYLDNLSSEEFTLAFVTKNGNVTTEDVFFEGQVEVGETLLVKGATQLLQTLEVAGKLDVFGDAHFRNTLTVEGPAYFRQLIEAHQITAKGNLTVRGQSVFDKFAIFNSGIRAETGDFALALGVAGDFSASGNVSLGGTNKEADIDSKNWHIDKDGNTSFNSLRVEATSTLVGILLAGNASTSIFSVSGSTYLATGGGNVGIGTTSPFAKLSVAGDGYFDGDITASNFTASGTISFLGLGRDMILTSDGSGNIISSSTPTAASFFATSTIASIFPYASTTALTVSGTASTTNFLASAMTSGSVLFAGAGGLLSQDNSNLFWDDTNNRLGLATTTPWGLLSLNPNALGAGIPSFVIASSSNAAYFIIDNGGRVGIGTTTPWAKLSITNTGSGPSFLVEDDTSPDSTPFVIDASGNVGIGTTTVATSGGILMNLHIEANRAFLHLASQGEEYQLINFADFGSTIRWQLGSRDQFGANDFHIFDAQDQVWRFGINTEATVSALILQPTNGNVGIGTTSPYAKLSVEGQTVSSYFTATSTAFASTLPYASTTALTVSGTASTTNQVISSLISGRIPFASTAGLLIDSSGLTWNNTNSRLTATYASTTAISGTNIDFGTLTLTNALGIASGGTNASSFTTSGNAVYYDGTSLLTAPLASAITIPYASTTALTVSGTASTTNLLASSLTSGRVPYITTAGLFTDDSDLTFNGSILTATYASTTAISSTGSAWFATSGGSVGIGTSSPQTKLEVVNTSSGSTADQLYLSNLASATSTASRLTFRANDLVNATSTANITSILTQNYNGGKADLAFSTLRSGLLTEGMRLTDAGFLGIGTTSPYAKLSVEGQVVSSYFTATSTAFASTLLYASTTAITATTASTTNLIASSLISSRIPYITTAGLFTDDSDLTFDGSILTATNASTTALTISGTASTTNQVISSLISGRIPFASTAGLLIDSSGLTWNNTNSRLTATYASTTAISGTNIDFGTLTLTNALGIASGGTNASSFITSGNAVYYDGTSLLTAPLTSAITIPYASTTALTVSGTASTTNLLASSLTSGRIPYITTAGLFTDDSDLTFNGSILTATYASTTAISSTGSAWFATSGGSVGIGTSSPQTKLEVVNTSSGSTADQLYLSNLASATSTASRLTFRANDLVNATSTAAITSILQQNFNTGKGDLAFSTLRSGLLTEGMRLTDAGFLGIGTTTPNNLLQINGGTAPQLLLSDPNGGTDTKHFYASSTAGALAFGELDDSLATYTERLRIDADGNMGLGTTSPSRLLSVSDDGTYSAYFSGRVGIGTNNPSTALHIVGTTTLGKIGVSNPYAIESRNITGLGDTLLFGDTNSSGQYRFIRTTAPPTIETIQDQTPSAGSQVGVFKFSTKDSAGNVEGFGYIDAVADVLTNGAERSRLRFQTWRNNSGQEQLTIDSRNLAVGISSTTPWATLSVTNTGSAPSFIVEDETSPDTTPFIIDSSGNVGIGTSSPYAKLSVEGRVVSSYFTATSTAFASTFPYASTTALTISGTASTTNLVASSLVSGRIPYITTAGLFTDDSDLTFNGSILTASYASTTALTISGTASTTNQVFSAMTSGSVLFAGTGGLLSQDNSNLFWDDSNNRLGIGTANPQTTLSLGGSATTTIINANNSLGYKGGIEWLTEPNFYGKTAYIAGVRTAGDGTHALAFGTGVPGSNAERMRIDGSGNVGIGTTSPYAKLSVEGRVVSSYFTATSTAFASTFPYASTTAITVSTASTTNLLASSLTSGRVPYITTAGLFTDDSDLTFNGSILTATYASTTAISSTGSAWFATSGGSVGIGTTSPWGLLSVSPNGITGPSFVVGSSFSATGGTITTSGNYTIHTFTSGGTFTPNGAGTVEYLVVAGGGGGGGGTASCEGGGGGAGGLRTATGYAVTAQAYSITVGAGGAGSTGNTDKGDNGSDSIFDTITSTGGGGGGSRNTEFQPGNDGGSGGGGGQRDNAVNNFGLGTAGQGNNGGNGMNNGTPSDCGGGGGGGAGAVGADAPSGTTGGAGGAGTSSSISGSSVTYAGGGGGAGTNTGSGGAGGAGGGGAGGATSAGTNGTANTGGGGGGGGVPGGDGGSGIVIIRYRTNPTPFVINSDGNVGIGTSSPYAKLSVEGQIVSSYFTATSTAFASTFPYASTTALTVSGTASTTNLLASSLTSGRVPYITTAGLFTDDSDLTFNGSILTATYASTTAISSTGSAWFATSGGSVGIGTTSPASLLALHGADPVITLGDTTASGVLWKIQNGVLANGTLDFYDEVTNVSALSINSSKEVTIGPTAGSSNYNLEVNGDSGVTQTAAGILLNDTRAGSGVKFGIHSEAGELFIREDTATRIHIGNSGFVQVGGVTGNFGGTLNMPNAGYLAGVLADTSDIRQLIGLNASDQVSIAGSNSTVIFGTGRVGIASTTPWGMLSLNPNALGAGVPSFVVGSSSATSFLIDNGGRVGIGTANPAQLLEVNGGNDTTILIESTSAGSLQIDGIRTGDADVGGIAVRNSNTTIGLVTIDRRDADNSGMIRLRTANAGTLGDRMNIMPNGNVGIGTTSPYAKLSVEGQVVSSYFTATSTAFASTLLYASTTALTVSGTASTTNLLASSLTSGRVPYITTAGLFTDDSDLTFNGSILTATYASTTAISSTGSAWFATSGGSVGIGTTTPWGLLSVNPDALGAGVPSFVIASSSNAAYFIIDNGGKVGIGTTTPAKLFAVAGNGYFGGTAGTTTIEHDLRLGGDFVPFVSPTSGSTSQISTTVDDPDPNVIDDVAAGNTSMAIGFDGLPIIAYRDSTDDDLKIIHCGTADCSSGNTTTKISDADDIGNFPSIAIRSDGTPIIAYWNLTDGDVEVLSCGNAFCSSGNTQVKVDDSANNVGQFIRMTIGADGNAILVYEETTPSNQFFVVHCGSSDCSSGNATTTIVADSNTTSEIGIRPNGLPIFAYLNATDLDIYAIDCTAINCSTNNVQAIQTGSFNGGFSISLAILPDGLPIISYADGAASGNDLWVSKCTTMNCSSVTSTEIVTTNVAGSFSKIVVGTDGLPLIFYQDDTNDSLKTFHCANSSCTTGVDNTIEDVANDVGNTISAAVAPDGLPVISHVDGTAGALKTLKCANADCTASSGGGFSSGSSLGSVGTFFNNIYAANFWGKSFNVTPFDLAENYPTRDASLGVGDIVMLDKKNGVFVAKATSTYAATVIGIVSTKPGITLGGFQPEQFPDERQMPIALAGRVPVKVSLEGGPIGIGDLITLSSEPGVGMKATTTGMMVGVALEAFDGVQSGGSFGREGKILVFVNLGQRKLGSEVAIDEINSKIQSLDLRLESLATSTFPAPDSFAERFWDNLFGRLTSWLADTTNGIVEFFAEIGNFKVVYTSELCLGSTCITEEAIKNLEGSFVSQASEEPFYDASKDYSYLDDETLFSRFLAFLERAGIWIENGVVRIAELMSDKITTKALTTESLCADDVCVNKEQLKALLIQAGGTSNNIQPSISNTQSTEETPNIQSLISNPDTEAPVITIIGNNPAELEVGATYGDLGVTVTDNVNSNLGYTASLDGGPELSQGDGLAIDTSSAGSHTITYKAVDNAGNIATAERVVNVIDPAYTPPSSETSDGQSEATAGEPNATTTTEETASTTPSESSETTTETASTTPSN